ncbi:hypothetical protein KA025_01285 [Candidatus Saccharibacteria bacterium]|jgi:hypothetical protein|nr:hypothetical protein [Candidatus Saccharibacteria bacterium]MBP7834700.1 hypothetical protein [Candidatus Saccharibacteria bacterium]
MYSGSTLTNASGNLVGAHQKIDRSARKVLADLLSDNRLFPSKKLILHFEGKNGPDSAKAKLDGVHAPWHFYDPFDPDDGILLEQIEEHFNNLVDALKSKNLERSGFEASWLAHALVDGLTPAHHYPYEEELEKLRGEGKETRNTVYKKIVIPGDNFREVFTKNWEMWGSKGLFTTHALFEMGAAMVMAPMTYRIARPNKYEIKKVQQIGLAEYFKRTAREVALLNMYEDFYKRGWTPKLAKTTRLELAPKMARTVTLAWFMAAKQANLATPEA